MKLEGAFTKAYICINKSTRFSPFYLMFGRQSALPIDYMFQINIINPGGKQKTYQKFVEEWATSMQQAFTIANEQVKKASKYNKQYCDKKSEGN